MPRAAPAAGLHLAHKPVGPSSFQLVHELMEEVRLAGLRRDKLPVCHGGALDPFAEGLVILLVGEATRLMELLHRVPKAYVAQIAWGVETDNGDHLGRPLARGDANTLTPAALDAALAPFLGLRDQVPPAHSNKRVDGERAYQKAWRGEDVQLPAQQVYLHEARWISHELPHQSRLELSCQGGYYVRALARDLGRALGCRAHLSGLSRTAIGPWRDPGEGRRQAITGRALFPWCPSRDLTPAELSLLRRRQPLPRGELRAPEWRLPAGFPNPQAGVRAFAGDALVAMLGEAQGMLQAAPLLRKPL